MIRTRTRRPFVLASSLLVTAILVGSGRLLPAAAEDRGPVIAVVPAVWTPPLGQPSTIDFAAAAQADAWLRDVVLGDPSFDSFRHAAGNPIVRGGNPFAWPVNGFLFEDPKSGDWFAYVGNYLTGYDFGPGKPVTYCSVHRSRDRGKTWENLGPIFRDPTFRFMGDTEPANTAPDVAVLFGGGRYHLSYDWANDNATWANITHPGKGIDNGVACAWADRPEGPFQRYREPTLRTSVLQKRLPMAWKYNRVYGASIVRRSHDWLVLALADSGSYFGWGMLAMTAPAPEGPWSDPSLVLNVEGDRYFPPTVEAFPTFVHQGYLYSPATSVALNRNFQVIHRAKIEQAHRPEAWHLYQNGTAWHADCVPHEGFGLWGQTFSGFIDASGEFHVLFPSREAGSGLGTINIASRKWDRPLRDRGFVFSGHEGRSLTLLRSAYRGFQLDALLTVRGNAARIVWGCHAPLGPNEPRSGAALHTLCCTRQQQLELAANRWQITSVDEQGKATVAAAGPLSASPKRAVKFALHDDGQAELNVDEKPAWNGRLPVVPGPIGLLADQGTHVAVDRFCVSGRAEPAVFHYLCTEAITGAAVNMVDWNMEQEAGYRFGVGAVRKSDGGRVKWNFHGRGFRLWLPKGPRLGRCEVLLNGEKLVELDLRSEKGQPSGVVLSRDDLANAYHALVVRSIDGRLPVDSLDVIN